MKQLCLILSLSLTIGCTDLCAQKSIVFYRTASSYESFKLDKLPFAMTTITPDALTHDSVRMANKSFYNNGHNVFVTADGRGYFVMVDKKGFIVTPDGTYWTCYYWDKERIKELAAIPDYSGEDEAKKLKQAMSMYPKMDERTSNFYITYMSFENKSSTYFAEDVLPVVFLSPDSVSVRGYIFTRLADKLFGRVYSYLYIPDNGTLVFRNNENPSEASFYVSDKNKANQLISANFKPEKQLADLNSLVEHYESARSHNFLDTYFKNLRSKRDDPALTATIIKYWNSHSTPGPASKVIFLDGEFHIERNDLGVPIRKEIAAWVLYKKNGKCFMQWHEYAFESLGGGVFDKELSQWRINGTELPYSGKEYEVDCNSFK